MIFGQVIGQKPFKNSNYSIYGQGEVCIAKFCFKKLSNLSMLYLSINIFVCEYCNETELWEVRCKIMICPTNVEHIEDCWQVHYNDSYKITWWILARKMIGDSHKTYWCITNVPVGIVSMTNQWGASMWSQGIFLWLTVAWCNIYFCFNEHAFCHEGF